jgi:type III secretion protein C
VLAQAVVGNAARYLLAQVAAMESRGRAHVSAKPKVTTMNGVSAVMDSQQTFYVKVAGYQSAQLFDVSTGTTLHVTPVATRGSQGYRIKLDVQVEDGQITGQQVDGLPVVSKNRITTQAFVNQGQSLLMAGYSNQVKIQSSGGVPGLSSIPVLGALFRQDHNDRV